MTATDKVSENNPQASDTVGLTLLAISLLLVNKDKDIQFKTLHLFLCQYTPPKKRKVFLPQSIYNSSSDCHSILKKKMLFNSLVMTQLKSKVAYEGSMVEWSTHWTRDLAAHGSESHFGHLLDLFLVAPSSNPLPLLLANWLLPASSSFLSCYVTFGLFFLFFLI